MISYLPEIYPDELVYSWFCRFFVHSGYLTHKMALQEILYRRCNNPSKEFLGHLSPEMTVRITKTYDIDTLILNHTMFPQYARFIPLEQKQDALHHIGHDFCDVHHLFPILPRIGADRFLKYCPLCAEEDRHTYGETYWHRTHQIRNMRICPKHKCLLEISAVIAKSDQTFTLCPAESYVECKTPALENDPNQIVYAQFLADVFHAPVQFNTDTPISSVLYYAMQKTRYMKSSGKTRYTQQFSEDLNTYYQRLGVGSIASVHQIQRVLLGERHEFSVVCQIAFFLGMRANSLVFPVLTDTQIDHEQASHYMRDKPDVDWISFDRETAPILEEIARSIYDGSASEIGRPERVSEKIIYRELGLPRHRLEHLPMCKAIFERYTESYEENWARRIVWGYNKLSAEGVPFYWCDIRRLTGVKKKNIDKVMPYIKKYTKTGEFETIIAIIC